MRGAIEFLKETFNKKLIGAEIGVEAGVHSLEIMRNLNMEKLYLIDVWGRYKQENNYYDYNVNYERVKTKFEKYNNIIIIKGKSTEISKQFEDNSLDFVYIDANHQYGYIREDIVYWHKKVKNGGYVCGHDYFDMFPGVIKAVNEFAKNNNYELFTKINKPISADWWFKKGR